MHQNNSEFIRGVFNQMFYGMEDQDEIRLALLIKTNMAKERAYEGRKRIIDAWGQHKKELGIELSKIDIYLE